MPLHILIILVVVGIAGIAATLHLLGLSGGARLDAEAAKTGWTRHFPDDHIIWVEPNQAHSAALVLSDHGLGLVWRFGADTVARRLTQPSIQADANGLRLAFNDFGTPDLRVTLTEREQETWARRIKDQT